MPLRANQTCEIILLDDDDDFFFLKKVWGEPITVRYNMVESAEAFEDDKIDPKQPG